MPKLQRIEILTFPNGQLLDVTGPLQVFATANDLLREAGGGPFYDPVVVAATAQVRTSSGLVINAEKLAGPKARVDTLIVAGGMGVNAACTVAPLVAWVRRRAKQARRVASVCSGTFLLATADLLDGRRVVTHWGRCAEFRASFPNVKLDPDPIFLRDGDIWTSAGVTAGIDLALAFVEADLGRKLALHVARELVVFLRRPGSQAQFSTTLRLQQGEGRFDRLHAFILENLRADLSILTLAERANMSPRSFCRHYRQATGRTPARAVEAIRIESACRLLEQGSTVSQAASRCGFGTEETMRRGFWRALGTNPQDYRERFSRSPLTASTKSAAKAGDLGLKAAR